MARALLVHSPQVLDSFIEKFVLCGSCRNPETFIVPSKGQVALAALLGRRWLTALRAGQAALHFVRKRDALRPQEQVDGLYPEGRAAPQAQGAFVGASSARSRRNQAKQEAAAAAGGSKKKGGKTKKATGGDVEEVDDDNTVRASLFVSL